MLMLNVRILTLRVYTPGGLSIQAPKIHGCPVYALRSTLCVGIECYNYILLNRIKVQEVALCTHRSICL
jgi:hypothetical protein